MPTKYEPIIGLEIHAKINTKSKMFCSCDNDSFNKEPNINTCPICMAFPGTLPVINKEAVEKGIKAAIALHCTIPEFCKFDRKNYFYPDLPKAYQISQYLNPLAINGYIKIEKKKIRITRLHLEEDAGKLIHVKDGTLCDYNRAGTPLMEIVSEPDLSTPKQASLYAKEIQKILRYTGTSDCDMEKGMMRFDINVSIRKKNDKRLGTKTEVKNLNSFYSLEKALEYEIKRQIAILASGEKVVHETLGFDPEKEVTFSQRSKEEAHDYRYFPEPDLPSLHIPKERIEEIKKNLIELPSEKEKRFIKQFNLKKEDAILICKNTGLANFFEETVKISNDPIKAVSLINTVLMKFLNQDKIDIKEAKITAAQIGNLINLINKGEISHNVGKELIGEMYKTGENPEKLIEEKGLKQLSNKLELENLCKKAIEVNKEAVEAFKNGKEKALGALVGFVMKETKGQANPKMLNDIIRKIIEDTKT